MRVKHNIDREVQVELDKLLKPFTTVYVNSFTEESAKAFSTEFNKAHGNDDQHFIPIIIDSYGGFVDSLLAMISDIQNSEKPVVTICRGKAMSCGSFLLSCGTQGYRYIDPNARVMVHEISGVSFGKNEEIQASAKEMDRINKMLFEIMAKNCGQQPNYWMDLMAQNKNADLYLTPEECLQHNLVNHIKIPDYTVSVQVTHIFDGKNIKDLN